MMDSLDISALGSMHDLCVSVGEIISEMDTNDAARLEEIKSLTTDFDMLDIDEPEKPSPTRSFLLQNWCCPKPSPSTTETPSRYWAERWLRKKYRPKLTSTPKKEPIYCRRLFSGDD